jgi:hypothetical protein
LTATARGLNPAVHCARRFFAKVGIIERLAPHASKLGGSRQVEQATKCRSSAFTAVSNHR